MVPATGHRPAAQDGPSLSVSLVSLSLSLTHTLTHTLSLCAGRVGARWSAAAAPRQRRGADGGRRQGGGGGAGGGVHRDCRLTPRWTRRRRRRRRRRSSTRTGRVLRPRPRRRPKRRPHSEERVPAPRSAGAVGGGAAAGAFHRGPIRVGRKRE